MATGKPLIEDLAEKNSTHRTIENEENKLSSWHDIQLSDGMRWHVNSRHHQAVKEPPFSCQLIGISDDNVLELLQSTDNRFLLVQSHPEMEEMHQSEIANLCIQWMKQKMDIFYGMMRMKNMKRMNSLAGET